MQPTRDDIDQIENDRELIYHYLVWCMGFIGYLAAVQTPSINGQRLVAEELSEHNNAAVDSLVRQVSIDDLELATRRGEINRLWSHGLYGPQLRAKLFAVHFLVSDLNQRLEISRSNLSSIDPIPNFPERIQDVLNINSGQKNISNYKSKFFVGKFLKRIIEAVDIPLDSILAALNLDGAIMETKKLLGVSID